MEYFAVKVRALAVTAGRTQNKTEQKMHGNTGHRPSSYLIQIGVI